MRRLSILLACSAALAVAACHDRSTAPPPGASTDPIPIENTVDTPVEEGFTCPPRMPAAKCESLGGHYGTGRPSTPIP